MNKSESIKGLVSALATAQSEFPPVPKSRTVTVTSKRTGGKYSFAYAPLDVILSVIRPVLKKNGLAFMQTMSGEALTTMLMHTSGEWIESDPLPIRVDDQGSQALGSAITYARRYALTAALGIVTEDDDDGNAADGNHVAHAAQRPGDNPDIRSAPAKLEWDAQPLDVQNMLLEAAHRISSLLKRGDIRGAYDEVETIDMEYRAALASQLDSKERAALKKEGERRKNPIDEKAAA